MDLYFLRHGLAGRHGDPKYKDDSLRPLTPEGKKKMHRVACGMKAMGLQFDAILSSPYLRARQTAETVALAFKVRTNGVHLTHNLLPPATIKQLLNEIHAKFPHANAVLLTGHEPHLTELISALLKSRRHLNIDFKKGGLCLLRLEGPLKNTSAVLHWILTPAQIILAA